MISDPKKSAWDGYRQRIRIVRFILPFLLVPFVFHNSPLERVLSLIFAPAWILWSVALGFACHFRCPNCSKRFFGTFPFPAILFNRACVNCEFPKWCEPPPKPPRLPPTELEAAISKADEHRLITNFLTLVLRDDPKSIGLRLDANGWADVDDLLKRANRHGIKLTRENLGDALTASENHRFERDQSGDLIRWVKG